MSKTTIGAFCLLLANALCGCRPERQGTTISGKRFDCGPAALAAFSGVISDGDSDFAVNVRQIYQIIDRREGDAVTMLDLKNAAAASGLDAEPIFIPECTDAFKHIRDYAIVYLDSSTQLPDFRQREPGAVGHFVLVRFTGNEIRLVDSMTLAEEPFSIGPGSAQWSGFCLILRKKAE